MTTAKKRGATRGPRAQRTPPPPPAEPSPPPADATPEPEQVPIDGVLVIAHEQEDGKLGIEVRALGNIPLTSAQTFLELGIANVRQALGLEA